MSYPRRLNRKVLSVLGGISQPMNATSAYTTAKNARAMSGLTNNAMAQFGMKVSV